MFKKFWKGKKPFPDSYTFLRYLEDIYTFTYREDSSMEDEEDEKKQKANGFGFGLASLQVLLFILQFK